MLLRLSDQSQFKAHLDCTTSGGPLSYSPLDKIDLVETLRLLTGHLNPAVAFALCPLGREPWRKIPVYFLFQTLGEAVYSLQGVVVYQLMVGYNMEGEERIQRLREVISDGGGD
ncbi:unnamed protein product [Boreogadus saida]